MAKIHSIETLHKRGWSLRRIARELKIERGTVKKYVLRLVSPEEKETDSKPTISTPGRQSHCYYPHRDLILLKLEQGLSEMTIAQEAMVDPAEAGWRAAKAAGIGKRDG
ncbi:MAG: hypothetical protein AAF591_22930 [Verrucomicrobiota bacterium]